MSCRGRSSWPWGLAFLTSLGSPDQVRGQVFSSPAALNSNAAIDNGIDVTPQIVTDRASNWLVAWNGPGNDVLVSRSTDNGATWTPVAAINPTPGTRGCRASPQANARHRRLVVGAGLQVASLGQFAAELGDDGVALGAEEAEREEHEVAVEVELAACDLLHHGAPVVLHPVEPHAAQRAHAAVAEERLGVDRPVAYDALLVRRRGAEDHGPVRPRELGAILRRLGQQLELVHGRRALAVRGAEAVRPRVAAAQDDDLLAGGEDLVRHGVAGDDFVLERQELHREVDALELPPGHR